MTKDSTHPDTSTKDRPRAGRVSSCARTGRFLTKTPRCGLQSVCRPKHRRPDMRLMDFAPAARSPWLPPGDSTGCLKPARHANGLRLNGKSNPQELTFQRP